MACGGKAPRTGWSAVDTRAELETHGEWACTRCLAAKERNEKAAETGRNRREAEQAERIAKFGQCKCGAPVSEYSKKGCCSVYCENQQESE